MGATYPYAIFLGCSSLPDPAVTALTTFTVQQPDLFECYKERQQQGAAKTRVSVMVYAKSYYFDGTRKVDLDEKTITVNPNVTPFPIPISLLMPNDGKLAIVDVTMDGIDCSDCANDHGHPLESTGSCPSSFIPNTNPLQYRAAKPRWNGSFRFNIYAPTHNFGAIRRIPNVSNTCNCTVQ